MFEWQVGVCALRLAGKTKERPFKVAPQVWRCRRIELRVSRPSHRASTGVSSVLSLVPRGSQKQDPPGTSPGISRTRFGQPHPPACFLWHPVDLRRRETGGRGYLKQPVRRIRWHL